VEPIAEYVAKRKRPPAKGKLTATQAAWIRRNFGNPAGFRHFAVRCRRIENDDPEELRLLNCFMCGMVPWSAVRPIWRESRLPNRERLTRIRCRLPSPDKCRKCLLTLAGCREEMARARSRHRMFLRHTGIYSRRSPNSEPRTLPPGV
jgi:hypothetical protein